MTLPRPLRSLLAGAASLLLLSCGDTALTAPEPETLTPESGLLGWPTEGLGLVECAPQPYDSVSQTIGPAGGTVQVGPHRLSIPPDALAAPVTITAVSPSEPVNRVRFQPAGLVFARPPRLTMSYANCNLLGLLLPKRIAYVTDALDILEFLLSVDNVLSRTVTGRLEHFSSYAVAW
jgi:hypothetical protein